MSATIILRNRNFLSLLTANTVLGTAFPMQLVLGGLAGLFLSPDPSLATLPSAIQTLAGLCAAAPFSMLMGWIGRREGFVLGGLLTAIGGGLAIQAIYAQSFMTLCVAHFLMGAGWASFQYFRFAASEVVEPRWRPVAISWMLTSLLIAAIVGPQLFIATRELLDPFPFAGAYAVTALIGLAGMIPLIALRMAKPDGVSEKKAKGSLLCLERCEEPLSGGRLPLEPYPKVLWCS